MSAVTVSFAQLVAQFERVSQGWAEGARGMQTGRVRYAEQARDWLFGAARLMEAAANLTSADTATFGRYLAAERSAADALEAVMSEREA